MLPISRLCVCPQLLSAGLILTCEYTTLSVHQALFLEVLCTLSLHLTMRKGAQVSLSSQAHPQTWSTPQPGLGLAPSSLGSPPAPRGLCEHHKPLALRENSSEGQAGGTVRLIRTSFMIARLPRG